MFGDPATNPKGWPVDSARGRLLEDHGRDESLATIAARTSRSALRITDMEDGLDSLDDPCSSSENDIARTRARRASVVTCSTSRRCERGDSCRASLDELQHAQRACAFVRRTRGTDAAFFVSLLQPQCKRWTSAESLGRCNTVDLRRTRSSDSCTVPPLRAATSLLARSSTRSSSLRAPGASLASSTRYSPPSSTAPSGGSCSHARRIHRRVVGDVAGDLAAADR